MSDSGWWSRRKARKRSARIAANERDIKSGRLRRAGLGVSGLDLGGRQAYTVDNRDYFYIDEDGFWRFFWSETEEIR